MRIVITGALGYVGSRLVRTPWPRHVDELILVDNLSAGRPAALFDSDPGLPQRFVQGDVRIMDVAELLHPGDVVIHLAAVTGSHTAHGDRMNVDEVNVLGTARVAEACAGRGAALLLVSSTSVYGGLDGDVDESTILEPAPDNAYALSKLRAEQCVHSVAAASPLRFAILRCGTMFGTSPGLRCHTAINTFCWQAATAQPLSVWRTALDQRRPILDLADAIGAMQFMIAHDSFDGRIRNVVSETATVREVVAMIREIVPDVAVGVVDSPVMTMRSQTVSARRIAGDGFVAVGCLRDGIRETLARWRALQGSPRFSDVR